MNPQGWRWRVQKGEDGEWWALRLFCGIVMAGSYWGSFPAALHEAVTHDPNPHIADGAA